ncbi:hypothetical protein DSO57_1019550 [Entomophthora muscae]|uniref:Uncharacterized protein n=2 Tax=Entomophthora muscae TaxID=34485 RepID=A0ACC2S615_9FUNG|nr:hypothetical protein DSO57_1019550 [Entomophthora muscae]
MSYPTRDEYLDQGDSEEYRNGYSRRESYSHLQTQLAEARQTISRLNSRKAILLTELTIAEKPKKGREIKAVTFHKRRTPPEDEEFLPPGIGMATNSKKVAAKPAPEDSRRNRPLSQGRIAYIMPRDKHGNYLLPLTIGKFCLLDLGKIDYKNKNFHSSRYIWPIGYTIQRYYHSATRTDRHALYTATVLNDGGSPSFRILADDNPVPIIGKTASGAWAAVISQANHIRGLKRKNTASGPENFGVADATISKMIQDLPNAQLCENYNWEEFQLQEPKKSPLLPLEIPNQASPSKPPVSSRAKPTPLNHRPKVSSSLRQETTAHESSNKQSDVSVKPKDNSIDDLILDMIDSSPDDYSD